MKNIILIGMPGCGKTTIGNELTNAMHFKFIDTDQLIKDKYQNTLPNLIKEYGIEKFKEMENEIYMNLDVENSIISTGGSAIFSESAMNHLKELGTVIYLCLPYEDLESRLGDYSNRGIVKKDTDSLLDVYNERTPLYNKYQDITIYCEGLTISEVVEEIVKKLGEYNKEIKEN